MGRAGGEQADDLVQDLRAPRQLFVRELPPLPAHPLDAAAALRLAAPSGTDRDRAVLEAMARDDSPLRRDGGVRAVRAALLHPVTLPDADGAAAGDVLGARGRAAVSGRARAEDRLAGL